MRILLINPNTSSSVTDLVADRVRAAVDGAAQIVPVTARFGAAYIASRAALAIAGHAALDCLAEHLAEDGEGYDAVYLACFGDPGLPALREVSPVPVVGMLEASCLAATRAAPRYGIVTGGRLWEPMLREIVASLGLSEGLSAIGTIERTGGEIARDPDAALAELAAACRACAEDGADAVVLGGAALGGLAPALRAELPFPLLCSVEEGARAALAAAGRGVRRPHAVATASTGLGGALAALLSGSGKT